MTAVKIENHNEKQIRKDWQSINRNQLAKSKLMRLNQKKDNCCDSETEHETYKMQFFHRKKANYGPEPLIHVSAILS